MNPFASIALAVSAIGGVYYFGEYLPAQERAKRKKKKKVCPPGSNLDAATGECVGFGNPVYDFCTEHGGSIEERGGTVEDPEVLVCVFPDGKEVNAWAYLRGEAEPLPPPPPNGTDLPDVPGAPLPRVLPPNPGEIMEAHTQQEAAQLISQLMGVPIAILMPFSKGDTYAKVKPVFVELAAAYPEIQFVESDIGQMLGTTSDVVALDVGIELGSSPHSGGMSLLLTDGPMSGMEKLQANEEVALPRWPLSAADTRDMQEATGEMVWPLEVLADRLGEIPIAEVPTPPVGFETMPDNYRFVDNDATRAAVMAEVQATIVTGPTPSGYTGVIAVEAVGGTPIYEITKSASVAVATANPNVLVAVVDHAYLKGTPEGSSLGAGEWGQILAGQKDAGDPTFEAIWPDGTPEGVVIGDLGAAAESLKMGFSVPSSNPGYRRTILGI